jgi:serine beta-lactamase-like protein LACTB, mitochondrial
VRKSYQKTLITLVLIGVGLVVALILGMRVFMGALTTPLHTDPKAVPSVAGVAPSPRWTGAVERARQIARSGLIEQNLPGLSVAVGVYDEMVWTEGFGYASVENRVPVSPAMRFRIGHVSKALTSVAAGLLLEKQRLDLDAEVQKYVPDFPKKQWPVKVRQAMANVAGFRHYQGEEADIPSGHCERAADGLAAFKDEPLLFEPETQYHYSTYGWVLVSAVIEAAAGEPFFTFMRTQVFEPLGMTSTRPDSATESIPDRVTFYFPRFSGDNQFGHLLAKPADYSCFAGAAAFISTPSDLVRLGMAVDRGRLLQPATVRRLQTPQQLKSGEETEYGLGWMLDEVPLAGESARLVYHASRSLLGGTTSFMTLPGRGIVIAVTANTSYADTRSIALRIADVFADPGKGK